MKLKLICLLLCSHVLLLAQTKLGDNPTVIHSGSLLELESLSKGLRLPRIKLDNVNAWTLDGTPANGMLIFNATGTAPKGMYYWDADGSKWVAIASLSSGTTVPTGTAMGGAAYYNMTTGIYYYYDTVTNSWVALSTLAGDVTGSIGTNKVTAIQGTTVSSIPPTTGQALIYNSVTKQWEPTMPSASIPSGNSEPATATPGQTYCNTTDGKLYYYNGTAWIVIGSTGSGNTTVVDALTSTSATNALSANQGHLLDQNKVGKERQINAGSGLSGGGDLTADRSLSLDVNSLTATTTAVTDEDVIPLYNGSSTVKIKRSTFLGSISGTLVYQGTWDANSNTPGLVDGQASDKGHYYVVSTAGTQTFNGTSVSFKVGDWIINNGTHWEKLTNSTTTATASQIANTAKGNITSTNVQSAIEELDNKKVGATRALTTPPGSGLSGGGDLTADRSLSLDVSSLTATTTAVTDEDVIPLYNGSSTVKIKRSTLLGSINGTLVYQGTWDANSNTPGLVDGQASDKGHYYVVSTAGTQTFNGTSVSFRVGDWVINNGTHWEKLTNSTTTATASQIANTAKGNITSTNVQSAIEELDNKKAIATRALTTAPGSGLSGGGDLTADRSLSLDVNSLTANTTSVTDEDMIPLYNGSSTVKVKRSAFLGSISGTLGYQGTWNANSNTPGLVDGQASDKGHYYVVSTAGTQTFNGAAVSFRVGDWIINNGTHWEKLSNSTITATASQIANTAKGNITSTNVQSAIEELDNKKAVATRTLTTAPGSGLSGGGDLTSDRSLSLDVNSLTATTTAVTDEDVIPLYNGSSTVKIKRSTLLGSINGTLVYQGTWNANSNTPGLVDGQASDKGHYYVVSTAGTQTFNGAAVSFREGDWVINNGTYWEKLTNSTTTTTASQIANTAKGNITSTNVQSAIEELDNKKMPATFGSDTKGDMLYFDGTKYVRLSIGSAGQVLMVNTGATAPQWSAVPTSNVYSTITIAADNDLQFETPTTISDVSKIQVYRNGMSVSFSKVDDTHIKLLNLDVPGCFQNDEIKIVQIQ